MSFLWDCVKGMTPLQMVAGFTLLLVLIGLGAWRDSNRAPHRYRPAAPDPEEPPRDRAPRPASPEPATAPRTRAHSH